MLGSTEAVATGFESDSGGIVLVASDGLAKYAARERVVAGAPNMTASALVDLARLPDGSLFDDACVVLARQGNGALQTGTVNWVDLAH